MPPKKKKPKEELKTNLYVDSKNRILVEVGKSCLLRASGKDDEETLWLVTEIHIKSGRKKEKVTNADDDRIEFQGTLIFTLLLILLGYQLADRFAAPKILGKSSLELNNMGKVII